MANKRQRNCQDERAGQIDGRKFERYACNRQGATIQKQCDAENADNTDKSCTNRRQHVDAQEQYHVDEPENVPNPTVMGNNNNRDQSLLSDPIINENQNFTAI